MAKERVLLVDDEAEFTSVLAERMQTRGLEVDSVASGAEALQMVTGKSYDAILLDLQMPGLDGIETLKRLKEKNPDLQIIMLTGHASTQKGIGAIKLGAMDFLEKTADFQEILEKITEAGENRMLLVEKRAEESIRSILKEKGW